MVEEDQRLIFLDSFVLIEYFRKTKKENSFLYTLQLEQGYQGFPFSAVVKIEIYKGVNNRQKMFWVISTYLFNHTPAIIGAAVIYHNHFIRIIVGINYTSDPIAQFRQRFFFII